MGLFKGKNKFSAELSQFNSKRISSVVERVNGGEIVLGKTGGITVTDELICILCNGHEVARLKTDNAVMAELMSGNGVDINGTDFQTGMKRHLIAYYSKLT